MDTFPDGETGYRDTKKSDERGHENKLRNSDAYPIKTFLEQPEGLHELLALDARGKGELLVRVIGAEEPRVLVLDACHLANIVHKELCKIEDEQR